ncbi:MAG: hypothetical protein CMI32_06055 [Opitutales bacterium]|jgi:hypothetical protein|nr:hypothetical protein [Opitutales bacterium]
MKYIITTALTLLIAQFAYAEKGKEITLTGKACCAKCCLKIADKCDNVFEVKAGGKKTRYYVTGADPKAVHKHFCKGVKTLTIVGTCKKDGDKLVLTATKIEKK